MIGGPWRDVFQAEDVFSLGIALYARSAFEEGGVVLISVCHTRDSGGACFAHNRSRQNKIKIDGAQYSSACVHVM